MTADDEVLLTALASPEGRAAGVPGGGAVMTAADLARFYSALLSDPVGVWKPEVLADATANIRCTLPDPLLGTPVNRTIGLVVAGDDGKHTMRYACFGAGVSPRAFGHTGAHGQVAWADPATGLAFAYVHNGVDRDMIREGARAVIVASKAAELRRLIGGYRPDVPRIDVPADQDPLSTCGPPRRRRSPRAAGALSDAVYRKSTLPLREFEAARTRIAQINDCQLCLDWRTARDVPDRAAAGEDVPRRSSTSTWGRTRRGRASPSGSAWPPSSPSATPSTTGAWTTPSGSACTRRSPTTSSSSWPCASARGSPRPPQPRLRRRRRLPGAAHALTGLGAQPTLEGGAEAGGEAGAVEPRFEAAGGVGRRPPRASRPDVLQEPGGHGGVGAHGPAADHPAVPPHGGSGVAVAVEQGLPVGAEVQARSVQPMTVGSSAGGSSAPRLGRGLGLVGSPARTRPGAPSRSTSSVARPASADPGVPQRPARPPPDVGQGGGAVAPQPPAYAASIRASSVGSSGRPPGNHTSMAAHRCWLLIHVPHGAHGRCAPRRPGGRGRRW